MSSCGVHNARSYPHRSDWCWEDPKDKKHHKLRTPHLERLIDYPDEGGILDGHDDVLGDIRRDLIVEIQVGRKSKKVDVSTTGLPYPPTIVKILPAQNDSDLWLLYLYPGPWLKSV